ncbi:sugar phosphate isomerase/epimerase [Candidatus Poribacteria bacterium]|nr:sugar phosphate isomerase/epimerase [Candidatus Poribacteria bacterium]
MRLGLRTPIPDGTLREKAMFVRRAGFGGIELGPEYNDMPTDDILRELDGTGVGVSAIVGTVKLLDPDPAVRRDGVRREHDRLRVGRDLGASAMVEVPVFGRPRFDDLPAGKSPDDYVREVLIRELQELAPTVEETGVTMLIEPLSRHETRFMNRLEQAAAILDEVGCPGIRILADFYHMNLEERDIASAIRAAGKHIGYVHVVDSNRREPGAGHTDFRSPFGALKSVGYDGWLVIESGIVGVEDGKLLVDIPDQPGETLARARRYVEAIWENAHA